MVEFLLALTAHIRAIRSQYTDPADLAEFDCDIRLSGGPGLVGFGDLLQYDEPIESPVLLYTHTGSTLVLNGQSGLDAWLLATE